MGNRPRDAGLPATRVCPRDENLRDEVPSATSARRVIRHEDRDSPADSCAGERTQKTTAAAGAQYSIRSRVSVPAITARGAYGPARVSTRW